MAAQPRVTILQWIKVENVDCVVSHIRTSDHKAFSGDIEVVFDPKKPTNHDVEWAGDAWEFCKRDDYGGYADRIARLADAVSVLRKGPWRA